MVFRKNTEPKQDTGYTEFINEPIIFDGFLFPRFPSLFYFADGQPGKRCLFIADKSKGYQISFEEGMTCMDVTGTSDTSIDRHIQSEYQGNDRYIHQLRTDPQYRPGAGNYAFFHMKIPNETGAVYILPGQMTASSSYQWSEGVEPVLIEMMNGIAVCKTKGDG